LPVELEAELFQSLDDLPISEGGEPAHVEAVLALAA